MAVALTPLFTEAAVFAIERSPLHFRAIRLLAFSIAPALAVAAVYAVAWGGFVPPDPDARIHMPQALLNPAPLIEAWALLGLLAVPYGTLVYPSLRALGGPRIRRCFLMALVAAIVTWGLFPSTLDARAALSGDPGRWGSIVWSLAGVSPVLYGRAVLVLPCLFLVSLRVRQRSNLRGPADSSPRKS